MAGSRLRVLFIPLLCWLFAPLAFGQGLPSDTDILKLLKERIDVQHMAAGYVIGVVSPAGRHVLAYGSAQKGGGGRPLDGDTMFEIGSVSKVLTSAILCSMVDQGEVKLEDPIDDYLPPGVKAPEWQGHKITIEDLATQSSGLPFFPTNMDAIDDPSSVGRYKPRDLYRFLGSYQLLHEIGVHWEYSNLGVGLLGFALGRRESTDYDGLLKRELTGPLGMASTSVLLSPEMRLRLAAGYDKNLNPAPPFDMSILAGAGAVRSTANDLLTFLCDCIGLNESALSHPLHSMLETKRPGADWLQYLGGDQALGWWIIGAGDDQIVAHAGDTLGYSCSIAYCPKTRVGIVALSNGASGGDQVAMHLLRPSWPFTGPDTPFATPKEVRLAEHEMSAVVGHYEAGPNVILVVLKDSRGLFFMAPGSPMVRLRAASTTHFFLKESPVNVDFEIGPDGKAGKMVLHIPGFPGPIPAKRV